MLQHLNSSYDVYVLDTFSRDNKELTYKMLLLDKNFCAHDDKILMCDKLDVINLYSDKRFEFHNCSLDEDNNIWLSVCKTPQMYSYRTKQVISMAQPKTLWEFLWDAIQSDVNFFIDDIKVPAVNITFSMASDDVILTAPTGQTKLLWTTTERKQTEFVTLSCTADFLQRWSEYLNNVKTFFENDGLYAHAEVNLYSLPSRYDGAYSSSRFCTQELAYLAEKYLLLKAHLHGVELGNWFMRRLNGINSTLFGFRKPHIKRSFSRIVFHVDAHLPNAKPIAGALMNDLDAAYCYFKKHTSLESCLEYFSLSKQECNNCYYSEFFKGFISQISQDRNVIKDHEYLNAEILQKEITSLACRIFVYRLVMLRRIQDSELVYLSEGILRMEVIS